MAGRVLGLDYGRRRIGVAMSDSLGITAQPVETWEGLSSGEAVEHTLRLIRERDIVRVVIGNPLTLKGEKGKMAREVERFVEKLGERSDLPIVFWDERLTSILARRVMHESNIQPSKHKEKIDRLAAVLLLQNYLDCEGTMKRHEETTD